MALPMPPGGEGADLNASDDKRTLDMVMRRFQRADDDRAHRVDGWREYYRLYRSFVDKQKVDGRANLFIPETFSAVETIVPRIIEAIFQASPVVTVLPRGPEDVKKTKPAEMLLDYQFDRSELVDRFEQMVKECLIYGTAIGKVRWRVQTKVTKRRQPVQIPLLRVRVGWRTVEVPIVLYDDPTFEPIDLMDFWIDPDATSIDQARYVIHRSRADMDELLEAERQGIYHNIAAIAEGENDGTSPPQRERLSVVGLGSGEQYDEDAKPVELLEYWEDDRIVTVANRSVVIRDEPNPYWHGRKPFVAIRDVIVPHEFYGIGEVEVIKYLQAELNTTRNQRIDNVSLIINRMWKILRGADIDPDQLVSRPGGFVEVNSMTDVEPLEMMDVSASSYNEEQIIKQDIQRSLGVYDFARGQSAPRRATATEVVSLQEVAEIRFRHKIRRMEREGLRKIAEFFLMLDQQFISEDRVLRITENEGFNWVPVRPEDIAGQYDLEPAGSAVEPLANKQMKQTALTTLYGIVKGHPGVDEYEMIKDIYEAFEIKDADRILNKQIFDILRQVQLAQIIPPQLLAGPTPPGSPAPPMAGGPVPPEGPPIAPGGQMPVEGGGEVVQ
ncbi:MAG: hypothetical protein HPY52_11105 [Firmicutes bacterium]|nr:hypothetical protein [Bacillota bacterium]